MSEESDVRLLVELAQLNKSVAQQSEGMGRVLQSLDAMRTDILRIDARVAVVEDKILRTERTALEAKRLADDAVTSTGAVHNGWKVTAEALRQTVETVRAETTAQTATLKCQDQLLAKLVTADERAELHRQWQRDQASEAERVTLRRRATVTWMLATIAAIGAMVAAAYGVLKKLAR